MMSTPADGVIAHWSNLTTRVLAPNAGPMTLDGTNTYVVRAPGNRSSVVVDPGPDIEAHLDRIERLGPISLVLVTHHHHDHAASIAAMAARTGAPVRASSPDLCIDGEVLRDGEVIEAAGTRITVIATPGHTADSVCFHLPDDAAGKGDVATGSILTGDTILGRGTTILAQPDGALRDYLNSLELLRRLPQAKLVLPAHGPTLPDLSAVAAFYLAHRLRRLTQARRALADLGVAPSQDRALIEKITDAVYPGVGPALRHAAEASTAAQLEFLATE